MDVLASHQACKFAREWAVADKGPLLLEFVTYRYAGHSYAPLNMLVVLFRHYSQNV